MKEFLKRRRRDKDFQRREKEVKENIVGAYMAAFDKLRPVLVYGAKSTTETGQEVNSEIQEQPQVESSVDNSVSSHSQVQLTVDEIADLDPYGVRI